MGKARPLWLSMLGPLRSRRTGGLLNWGVEFIGNDFWSLFFSWDIFRHRSTDLKKTMYIYVYIYIYTSSYFYIYSIYVCNGLGGWGQRTSQVVGLGISEPSTVGGKFRSHWKEQWWARLNLRMKPYISRFNMQGKLSNEKMARSCSGYIGD